MSVLADPLKSEPLAAREGRREGEQAPTHSTLRLFIASFAENKLAVVGVALVVGLVFFCFVGPLLYHTNQISTNLNNVDLPPGAGHPLGTDNEGYDILGRLMVGGQSSLEIGFGVAIIAPVVGMFYGTISGFCGGVVDAVMMRVVDVTLAIPTLFLIIYLASAFRPTVLLLILVLSFLSWLTPARLTRAESLVLRGREFADAVRVMGGRPRRIIVYHMIPNMIGTIVVNATFQVANAILIVATLSFIGLGLPPPAATWGGMLSTATNYLNDGYWWQVWPVLAMIVVAIVSFNLIGDGLRDAFETRLRRR